MEPLSFASHTHLTAEDAVDNFNIDSRASFSKTMAQKIANEMANIVRVSNNKYANDSHWTPRESTRSLIMMTDKNDKDKILEIFLCDNLNCARKMFHQTFIWKWKFVGL